MIWAGSSMPMPPGGSSGRAASPVEASSKSLPRGSAQGGRSVGRPSVATSSTSTWRRFGSDARIGSTCGSRRRSTTSRCASACSRTYWISSAFSPVLIGQATAPSAQIAKYGQTKSGPLKQRMLTRVPCPTPRWASTPAVAATRWPMSV